MTKKDKKHKAKKADKEFKLLWNAIIDLEDRLGYLEDEVYPTVGSAEGWLDDPTY